jgi:hypothetical protein
MKERGGIEVTLHLSVPGDTESKCIVFQVFLDLRGSLGSVFSHSVDTDHR